MWKFRKCGNLARKHLEPTALDGVSAPFAREVPTRVPCSATYCRAFKNLQTFFTALLSRAVSVA
jgi:hypothetical protein